MSQKPATRVTDQFAHSSALGGLLTGLAIGLAVGVFIVATGGVGAIAVGAAIGVAGAGGLAGQAIGGTVMGPPTGAITIGSPNVMTNNLPQAATVIGIGPCSKESGVPQAVATGAETVLINNMPAARKDEKMTCSATIISGSPNVLIGGASVQVLPMEPEVPTWLSNTMLGMTIGGAIIATGGIAAGYGLGAAAGSLVGGMGGGYLGGMGGQWAAAQMGFGATGQAIGGVLGGFIGGAAGGLGGFRGGQMAGNRIWSNPTTTAGVWARQGTSGGPPAVVAKVNGMPPAFQSEYAAARAAGWKHPDGKTWYPPNDGAVGNPARTTLPKGAQIDRYGHEGGSFTGKPGDSYSQRAMVNAADEAPKLYTVEKPMAVEQAEIAPWFDQPGGGTQYKIVDPLNRVGADGKPLKYSVGDAKNDGFLSGGGP